MLNVNCTTDVDCEIDQPVVNGNGVKTGRCNHDNNTSLGGTCEIYAWCPVEKDNQPKENAHVCYHTFNDNNTCVVSYINV